jgi:hypothetical protein
VNDPHAELLARNQAAWAALPWWRRLPWGAWLAAIGAAAIWALQLAPFVPLLRG